MLANKIFDLIDTIYAITNDDNIVKTNNLEKYIYLKNIAPKEKIINGLVEY